MSPAIWDAVVRVTHWTTALLFLGNYLFTEGGSQLHQWSGYMLLVSVFVRFVWGFVGSPAARFSSFFPSVSSLWRYIQSFPDSAKLSHGHNPVGALMALFLWFMLVVCALSGYLQETDMFWGEDWPQILHETSADLLMIAIIIHVTAVFLMQRIMGRKLIMAMLTGRY